ncbi:MAG: ankyrin repeat domain-containing protein [Pseudomonadota bacterium]
MVILKESPRDWGLVAIVVLLSLGANLPEEWTAWINFDRRFLLGGLIAVVAVALVRYLKFTLILVIVALAAGANVPEDIAREFGIDPQISLLGLVAMIVISLSNRLLKLPTGLEKSGRSKTAHGAAALFTAILKGRIAVVQSLLNQGVNVNVRTVSGKTPLMAAAYKGYSDIVQMLLDNGADVTSKDGRGDTAEKIAERGGYTRIVELLRKGGGGGGAVGAPAKAQQA